jgi:DNA-binding transcriptional LysR family regulator
VDRLRCVQYFVTAARLRSFSRAARALDVSVPAVTKGVNVLERHLGVTLFERSPRGLSLTPQGAVYLESAAPVLQRIDEADAAVRGSDRQAEGTVVVVATQVLARLALAPALPRFLATHPRMAVDLRDNLGQSSAQALEDVDVVVALGWGYSDSGSFVARHIGVQRYVVCAAPAYWRRAGVHPGSLADHNCIVLRNTSGIAMDVWGFRRGDEEVSVIATGSVVASNSHRDMITELALAGVGLVRASRWSVLPWLESGRLETVLGDWEPTETPPVVVYYRASARRSARVRAFVDFAAEALARATNADTRSTEPGDADRPEWLIGGYRFPRASSLLQKARRGRG